MKNVDSKGDNTSKDLADLDFDISGAIQESNYVILRKITKLMNCVPAL